jgi:hypothetical protein
METESNVFITFLGFYSELAHKDGVHGPQYGREDIGLLYTTPFILGRDHWTGDGLLRAASNI